MRTLIGMGAVLGLLVLVASARADEKMPPDDLPKAVRDAAKAKFPEGEIKSAYLREENGQRAYHLKVKQGDTEQTVRITPTGTILEGKGMTTREGQVVQGRSMIEDRPPPPQRRRLFGRRGGNGQRRGLLGRFSRNY